MAYDDVITRNDDGELAVRTVSVSEGNAPANYDDVMTRDENGNLAVRVIGNGGGGDQHNLGYYATQSALEEAHPTAEAGDWAIVGATDTVWIWDEDTSAWVDSDQKGQVTSVNNQTGAVTVSEVPSQTGNAGKFLTTDGTDASWSDKPLVNNATGTGSIALMSSSSSAYSVVIGRQCSVSSYNTTVVGQQSTTTGDSSVAIGYNLYCSGRGSVCLGQNCRTSANNAIEISSSFNSYNNTDANTFKVGNENGNFEIMSADGTIPEARLADTTNAQQGDVLTLDSTGNAVWQAGGGGGLPDQTGQSGKFLTTDGTDASWSDNLTKVNTTVTLAAANWSGNAQTVSVTGITATGVVFVNPDPTDQADYTSAGIICSAQATGTLTFTCDTTPANDIDVVVVML